MMHLLDETFASIQVNPQMVARANIPWQAMADNSRTAPVIAGFQLPGSGFSPGRRKPAPASIRTSAASGSE